MTEDPEKLLKKGNKDMEKGLFKWSKDYVSASMNYTKAAEGFMQQKSYDKAIECYQKLILVNEKLNDTWGKGRCYEHIINALFMRDGVQVNNQLVIENFD